MLDDPPFSRYGRASVEPSPVRRMMAEFAGDFREGVDVNLGVGYVNERTIPRRLIAEATEAVLSDPVRYERALNYGASKGAGPFLDAVRRYLAAHRVGGLDEQALAGREIVAGVSGATSLLEAIAAVLDRGIVVTADPMYYIYCNFLERMGWEILPVPEDHDGIRTDLLAAKLDALGERLGEVRFFYVVTVNNPTGTILSNARRAGLLRAAVELSRRLGRQVPLVFDRAYEELIHDPAVEQPRSAILDDREGIVYEIATVSKILAPGLRIGYMVGPDSLLLRTVVQRVSDIGFSAPPINQLVAAYMLDHHVAGQVSAVNAGYRRKALAVRRRIDELLGDYLQDVTGGSAGFYFYLTFKDVRTGPGSSMFKYLSRTTGREDIDGAPYARRPRVIYVPGCYCVHPAGIGRTVDILPPGRPREVLE
ncbi:MAG: pyridoxal phosphate-dependent aminotransferase, partial [Planctomycetes bacterium]|nr:pyridoxal phosphate-dependent aminotransferase [Planctomycetota bacterium]